MDSASNFFYHCVNGKFEEAKLALSCGDKNDILCRIDKNDLLRRVSSGGHLHVLKWLLDELKIDTDGKCLRAFADHPFRMACINGHISVAVFICERVKLNEVHKEYKAFLKRTIFWEICRGGHYKLMEWFIDAFKITMEDYCLKEYEAFVNCSCPKILRKLIEVFGIPSDRSSVISALRVACEWNRKDMVETIAELCNITADEVKSGGDLSALAVCEQLRRNEIGLWLVKHFNIE